MPQIKLSFGNLGGIRGMVGSLTRGVLPSVFQVYAIPQDGFDMGVQTLTFGLDSNTISLSGCIAGSCFVREAWDGKHPLWSINILDRRWKWQFSSISGDYNRRKPDGTLDNTTQQTPQQLAAMLGSALGENIDASRMPYGVWPRVKWNNQRADLALQWLCDYTCCDVVLNPVSGGVEIWPLGQGATTPTGISELRPKYRFVPRVNIPSSIEVHGGDSLWQTRLKLQAVGINKSDGKQKKLSDVEWKPTDWSTESPFSFPSQTDTVTRAMEFDEAHREFRVIGQQDGSVQVPGCTAAISSIDCYLLNDYRLDYETDLEGYSRQLPYYVDGDYYAYTDLPNNTSSAIYTGDSRLYPERRVVKFPFPLFKLTSSGAYDFAQLYLTTSYKVQDNTHSNVHLYRTGGLGGSGGRLILRRPEVYATYKGSSNTEAQANSELDQYVTLFQQRFAYPTASEITYGGFFSGTLDGNIAQAVWTIHPTRGFETKVCEQEELDRYSVGRAERARRMSLARLEELMR